MTTLLVLILTKAMNCAVRWISHIMHSDLTLRLLCVTCTGLFIEVVSFSENLRNILLDLIFQ